MNELKIKSLGEIRQLVLNGNILDKVTGYTLIETAKNSDSGNVRSLKINIEMEIDKLEHMYLDDKDSMNEKII